MTGFDFVEDASTLDSKAINKHIQEARQNFANTLIVCTVETKDQGEKEVYGAKFSYYDAAITVKIYDVNSRKVLHNFNVSSTRGSSFSAKAQEDAVTEAVKKIAPMLIKWFKENGSL